jgi:hypothetical protein
MVLATAGGPGDGIEVVCLCCGTSPVLIAAFVIALIAAVRRSASLLVLSVLLIGFVGVVILEA